MVARAGSYYRMALQGTRGVTQGDPLSPTIFNVAMNVVLYLPANGSPTELPGGGIPGPSGDEDGNVGALPAPAYPRHRGHFGGGKPLPPTVQPMQHSGSLAGTEQQAPCHSSVRQGSRAEESAAGGGGAEGELGEGL